jgi:hypothetical protein
MSTQKTRSYYMYALLTLAWSLLCLAPSSFHSHLHELYLLLWHTCAHPKYISFLIFFCTHVILHTLSSDTWLWSQHILIKWNIIGWLSWFCSHSMILHGNSTWTPSIPWFILFIDYVILHDGSITIINLPIGILFVPRCTCVFLLDIMNNVCPYSLSLVPDIFM